MTFKVLDHVTRRLLDCYRLEVSGRAGLSETDCQKLDRAWAACFRTLLDKRRAVLQAVAKSLLAA